MTEHQLYEQVAYYMQMQYQNVIYRFDLASDMKLTVGQATKHKRLHRTRGYPDMFIAEPKGHFNGLFIELKKDGTRLKKKDGDWASDHIKEQAEMLQRLLDKGYLAVFGIGFENCKEIIDKYMKGTIL